MSRKAPAAADVAAGAQVAARDLPAQADIEAAGIAALREIDGWEHRSRFGGALRPCRSLGSQR